MMSARIVGYVRGMSDAKMPKLLRGRILIIHDVRPMLNKHSNIRSRDIPLRTSFEASVWSAVYY